MFLLFILFMTEMALVLARTKIMEFLKLLFLVVFFFFNDEGQAINLCHTQSTFNLIALFSYINSSQHYFSSSLLYPEWSGSTQTTSSQLHEYNWATGQLDKHRQWKLSFYFVLSPSRYTELNALEMCSLASCAFSHKFFIPLSSPFGLYPPTQQFQPPIFPWKKK